MTTDPQAEYTAELAERTVVVTWPDNERGGATPPPDGWANRALDSESTLHEIDEGSITGCSVLRWRDDPRPDAELVAVSLALVTGAPTPVSPPPAADRAGLRDRVAEALISWTYRGKEPDPETGILETVRANAYSRADAVLAALFGPIPAGTDVATWTAIRAIQLMNEAGQQRDGALSDADRKFLTFALDLAADQMASRGDEFDADDEDAMERLRRMAAEEQQQECTLCGHRTCMLGKPCGVIATEHGDLAEPCGCTGVEAQQQPDTETLPASTAPLATGFPLVKGNCPACCRAGLFLGTGGYPTCSNHKCPEPDAATTVLEQYANEAHQPEHTWTAELRDPLAEEWAPGTRYVVRERAVDALAHARRLAPTWTDGTPTERRLVRATITYTVETDASAPAAGQPPTDTGEEAAPPVCEGFQWIGQSFATCDRCAQPAWEHAGEEVAVEGAGPFDTRRTVRPWKPGEADAIRAKWAPIKEA